MSFQLGRNFGKVAQKAMLAGSRSSGSVGSLKLTLSKSPNCNVWPQCFAALSTSSKSRGTGATTSDSPTTPTNKDVHDPTNVTGKKKYWRTLGFNWYDQEKDQSDANFVMFMTVTVLFVGTGFLLAYYPDFRLKDWSQREAYIEIARREALGLPYVDPDLIPVSKINLPSEEELEDFEIII